MTGAQYQKAINRFNLTQMDSARLFRVNGRTVRRWIADDVPIPHSVAIVLGVMRRYHISPNQIAGMFVAKKKKKKEEPRLDA